jgi:TPR repeat protein
MMAGGTIVNWNTGNVLCSFLSARALFETFAFLWNYDRAINEARKAGTLAEFEKLTANRLAATRNPKRIEKNPEWESTNILTAIGRLSEEHPWAKTAYDFMSYRCHPNTEGMFETFADLDAETGTVNFSTHNDNAGWAFRIILGVTALITNAEKIFDRLEDAIPKIADELRDRDFRELVAQSEREQEQFEQFGEDEKRAFLGDAHGQFAIGRAFSTGAPMIQKDLVRAHFWLGLAAAQGHKEAARCLDKIAQNMTSEQINEAQTLATTWKPMTPEEFEKHNEEIIERLDKHFANNPATTT